MLRLRYTQWDGRQTVRFDPDKVFEKLSEYLSITDDVDQALDWLMRHGTELDGMQVMGLDELLEQLNQQLQEKYNQFNLDHALDDLRRKLDELIDLEREALESAGDQSDAAEKNNFLDQLSRRLSQAIEALRSYRFKDEDAAREFEHLLEELANIQALENFIQRHGQMFEGRQSLGYEEALELMRQIEQMKKLEESLSSGELGNVDLAALQQLLGEEAARNLRNLQQMMMVIRESGYLMPRQGRTALSPRGIRKIGKLALREIYQGLLRDKPGSHQSDLRGIADVKPDVTRAYHYGDPMNLDLVSTLKKSLARKTQLPLEIRPDDFEVYDTDLSTSAATVLLLDMSWSMSWEERFAAGKKVALALESLIHTRYPRDYFGIVGFFTRARELKVKDLPEASWNMGDPFTNLQDGLRLAARLLDRQRSRNKHVIVITDGQPTAYFSGGRLYCEWPLSFGGISMRAAAETLKEVERVTRKGITINTFMLDDSPSLRAFVEKMTRINKGRALYTRPDQLGQYLLVDYLGRKRKRV